MKKTKFEKALLAFARGETRAIAEIAKKYIVCDSALARKVYNLGGFDSAVKRAKINERAKKACVRRFRNFEKKHNARELVLRKRYAPETPSDLRTFLFQRFRENFVDAPRYVASNYFKILIRGRSHIWLASPVFGHADYNKFAVCAITPELWRVAEKYNAGAERIRKNSARAGATF